MLTFFIVWFLLWVFLGGAIWISDELRGEHDNEI